MMADVQGSSVLVQFRGGPFLLAHTAVWTSRFLELEIHGADGPSLRSLRTRRAVQVERADVTENWPALTDLTDRFGIRSIHAEPLPLPQYRGGAVLTLYSTSTPTIEPPPQQVKPVRDDLVAALAGYCAAHPHQDHAVRLRHAVLDKEILGHVTGILMARHQLTQEQAGRLLHEQATAGNATLTTTARAIIRRQR